MNRQEIINRLYAVEQADEMAPLFHELDQREIDDLIRAVEEIALPQKIATAPDNDGWILGQVCDGNFRGAHPWVLCTRGDGGWFDEAGNPVEPVRWLELPDPQPKPTGWRKAEGEVVVECAWFGDSHQPVWIARVILPNGEDDETREPIICFDPMNAVDRANDWALELGLEKREANMDHAEAPFGPTLDERR